MEEREKIASLVQSSLQFDSAISMQLEETLTPALSLLKEGRGRRLRRTGPSLNRDANAPAHFLLPLLALKRGEGRGEEFRMNRCDSVMRFWTKAVAL